MAQPKVTFVVLMLINAIMALEIVIITKQEGREVLIRPTWWSVSDVLKKFKERLQVVDWFRRVVLLSKAEFVVLMQEYDAFYEESLSNNKEVRQDLENLLQQWSDDSPLTLAIDEWESGY